MSHRPLILLLLCLTVLSNCFAQNFFFVSGRVIDSKTKEPLAFVNMVVNSGNTGGTTDIDGKFNLRSAKQVRTIMLSYVGYEPKWVTVGSRTKDLLIEMVQKEIDLQEVDILPGINPAHRIIRNVMDNRDINDPEKIKTFSYTAYDKTVFTADKDTTLKGDFSAHSDTTELKKMSASDQKPAVKTDSLKTDSAMTDSLSMRIDKFINTQYAFLMENVTKRKFMAPDKNYNKVIATKMSGFKDPILVFLSTQIQSFSFYKPFISIFMKDYVNPIGNGCFSKYFFKLEDTTYVGKDTVFIISFRPRKGTNFDGMKGVIAINSYHWAIQNVNAEPYGNSGGINVKIHQLYELIDGQQWFPVQLNTDVRFNNLEIGKYKMVASGHSYIRDIVLNPDLVRREFNHLDVEVDKEATFRKETFWNQYRVDTLSNKDRQTYKVLDSIGNAEHFDKKIKNFQTLLTGRIPWGIIDLDINRFLNYNTYEGLVAGLGIHTNDRLADWFKVGGFYQYAFGISTSKYGGDVSFLINRRHDVTVSAAYSFDLTESGGVSYPNDYASIISGNFRQLMLTKLDRVENVNLSLGFRAFKYMLFNAGISHDIKTTTTVDLTTVEGNDTLYLNHFRFTTLTAGVKWAYGEKFIQTVKNKFSLGTKYPVVWLQYSRGMKNFLGGEYEYDRFDLKIRKTFNIKYFGKLTIQLNGGYVDQPIPVCNLYYAPASYRQITLYAPNSFGTMRNNEFLSNTYASLYLYHDFGYLLFKGKKWFHPEFALSQNIGFGWLDNKERYEQNIVAPKEMNLGYYESGLLVNNLVNLRIYTVGIGAFYRWGPYSLDNAGNNFAYKISMIFPL